MTAKSAEGHGLRPHTADLIVEAWAPNRERCIEQAILGVVDSFADIARAAATGRHMAAFTAGDDTELLVAAMEEVMYLLDARGEVPVAATVSARDGDGVDVVYATAPLRTVETIGPVPKGVTRHALGFAATDGMWRCTVLIDV